MKQKKTITIPLPSNLADIESKLRVVGEHLGHWHDAIVNIDDKNELVIEYEEE